MQLTVLVSVLATAIIGSFAIPIATTERHAVANELERGLNKPRLAAASEHIEQGLAKPRSHNAFEVEDGLAVMRTVATEEVEQPLTRPRTLPAIDIEAGLSRPESGLAHRRAAASRMEVGLAEKRVPEVEKGLIAKGSMERRVIE